MTHRSSSSLGLDRRQFIKSFAVGGIGVTLLPFPLFAADTFETPPLKDGNTAPPNRRIDGYTKVTGHKLYPIDYRASDMAGWPTRTGHAMLLRAKGVSRVFVGLDLSELEPAMRPDLVILAEDLITAKLRVPAFYAGDLLCPVGRAPAYLGQPLTLLIWNEFAAFAVARQQFRTAVNTVRLGTSITPPAHVPYGGKRFVRIAGPTHESEEQVCRSGSPTTGSSSFNPG